MTLFSPSEFFRGYRTPWGPNMSDVDSRGSGTWRHEISPVEHCVGDNKVYTHKNIGIGICCEFAPHGVRNPQK